MDIWINCALHPRHVLTYARTPVTVHPGGVGRAGGAGGVNRGGPRRSLRILLGQIQDAPDGKTELVGGSHRVLCAYSGFVLSCERGKTTTTLKSSKWIYPKEEKKKKKDAADSSPRLRAVQTPMCAPGSVFTQTRTPWAAHTRLRRL